MKKRVLFCALAALLSVLCLSLVGCKGTVEKYYDSISEIRDRVYEGAGEHMRVSVVSGVHEQPFVADGKADGKKEFTVITVAFDEFAPNLLYSYAVNIGGTDYSGVMSMHPFGESCSVELDVRAREERLSVTVKLGDMSETVEAVCKLEEDDVSADAALDAALTALKDDLKKWKSAGGYDCEIYVRFIANPINADGGYYWYVAFIRDETYAALIDRKTAGIAALKN